MTERLMPFAFEEQLVRCRLDEHGEPWFVAKDVALALGYQWNGVSRIAHVPEEWRRVTSVVTLRGDEQNMQLLSEQGLYFFVARSDKPRALPFQKWLAGEVLPSLRRTGRYALPEAGEEAPDLPVIPRCTPCARPCGSACGRMPCRRPVWTTAAPAAAVRWFARLCRMVTARPVGEVEPGRNVPPASCALPTRNAAGTRTGASMQAACMKPSPSGGAPASRTACPPSMFFGRVMPARFAKVKRGGKTWYLGLSLTQ